MARNFEFAVDEFYHVYNRGHDKRNIFLTQGDRVRFVFLLYLANGNNAFHFEDLKSPFDFDRGERLVDIGAYCLMPNHFHLLIYENCEGGISRFMQRLSTGYTMYFNKKRERTGSLFENRFRARHASDDDYLHYLFAYVHLNPLKIFQPDWRENGLKNRNLAQKFLQNYKDSSYSFFSRQNPNNRILNVENFPPYFSTGRQFSDYLDDWMKYQQSPEVVPRG